jgi:hypothetical protein
MDHFDGILNDLSHCPGLCPLNENRITADRIFQSPDKTLFGACMIPGKQERQQVQMVHILFEDSTEI